MQGTWVAERIAVSVSSESGSDLLLMRRL